MSIFSKIKLFRSNNNENSKDINNIIDTSDNSSRELTPEEKNMLNNVIGFGESRVEDCMVPRADIVGLELDTDVKDILKIFLNPIILEYLFIRKPLIIHWNAAYEGSYKCFFR